MTRHREPGNPSCETCGGLLWVPVIRDGVHDGMLPCPDCRPERRRYLQARVRRVEADWQASQQDQPGHVPPEALRAFAAHLAAPGRVAIPLPDLSWQRSGPEREAPAMAQDAPQPASRPSVAWFRRR